MIGVVGDTREYEVDAEPPITAFFPAVQLGVASRFVVVRTSASAPDAAYLTGAVNREIHALDPEPPAYDVSTMDQRLHDSLARRRLSMLLLAAFSVWAE